MATAAEQDRRKKAVIFILIGALALLLIAAAAGYVSFPWWDNWFGSGANASLSNGGDGAEGDLEVSDGGDVSTDDGNGCFLGLICLNASANADGTSVNANADDEGVDVDAETEE
jgi:hypothetical protein